MTNAQPTSLKPEMSNDELAAKLLCILSQEMIRKADLFDYLCWLEEKEQSERVPGADFLVLASDGCLCLIFLLALEPTVIINDHGGTHPVNNTRFV